MKKVLIFDFGGTIVTDESDDLLHKAFYKEFLNKFNIPVSEEELFDFLKKKMRELLKTSHLKWENLKNAYTTYLAEFLEGKGISPKMEHLETFKELYLFYHEKYTEPFPGAVETLIKLKSAGFRLAIISNIDNEIIEPVLKKLGIYEIFELIVTSEELGYGKPAKEIFQYTLNKLGISPDNAIFIGDSLTNDVEGAKNMGIEAIHFGKDCKNWDELYSILIEKGVEHGDSH
ncbi:MAG: HAD family hydrolase [candidate division WOR-3 bacterium]